MRIIDSENMTMSNAHLCEPHVATGGEAIPWEKSRNYTLLLNKGGIIFPFDKLRDRRVEVSLDPLGTVFIQEGLLRLPPAWNPRKDVGGNKMQVLG